MGWNSDIWGLLIQLAVLIAILSLVTTIMIGVINT